MVPHEKPNARFPVRLDDEDLAKTEAERAAAERTRAMSVKTDGMAHSPPVPVLATASLLAPARLCHRPSLGQSRRTAPSVRSTLASSGAGLCAWRRRRAGRRSRRCTVAWCAAVDGDAVGECEHVDATQSEKAATTTEWTSRRATPGRCSAQ